MIRNGRQRPETTAGLPGVIQSSFVEEVTRFGQNSFCRDSLNGTRPHIVSATDGLGNPECPYGFVIDRIKAFNEAICKQCPGITWKREHFFGKFFYWNGHLVKDTSLGRSIHLSLIDNWPTTVKKNPILNHPSELEHDFFRTCVRHKRSPIVSLTRCFFEK